MSFQLCLFKPVLHHSVALTWIGTAVAVGYAAYVTYNSSKFSRSHLSSSCGSQTKGQQINVEIKKDEPKIVDTFDVEDLSAKTVLCRCWRSKCFPKCDGSHAKHNKETGDNIGPVIITRQNAPDGK